MMRLATYNIEWMNALFDDANTLVEDTSWSARYNITKEQQIKALGVVFQAMDADAVLVIEAPDASNRRDTAAALEAFAERFKLRTRAAIIGFANDTQQEIALLYDPDRLRVWHDPKGAPTGSVGQPDAPRFDGRFLIDLDVDAQEDTVMFSKPPLELAAETSSGFAFRLIGAHLKSKAAHGARTPDDVMRHSIANRRKQLAQAIWLRQRISGHVAEGDPLVVMGDLNDGPGLDRYESLFGRSSVEIVMGEDMFDPHAARALGQKIGAMPTSARFWNREDKRYFQALLDYAFVSQDLRPQAMQWRIWHPMDDPECWSNAQLRQALVDASDHFPVSLDLSI